MNNKKIILGWFLFLIFILLDIGVGILQYERFIITYGDKSFSKGIIGIVICCGGNILFGIGIFVTLILYILKK